MTSPIDNTLLELFRTEVELHSETLTAGMLALNRPRPMSRRSSG
jgi:hypothetical protein